MVVAAEKISNPQSRRRFLRSGLRNFRNDLNEQKSLIADRKKRIPADLFTAARFTGSSGLWITHKSVQSGQSVDGFVPLCLGGENPLLFIDHCSLVIEQHADAYRNTLIFTAPGTDGVWFTDDDVQSSYGANEIIYCGYRFDPETDLYYVRNRTYNPALGRWLRRDPIGYSGGINLYEYVNGRAVAAVDPAGLSGFLGSAWGVVTAPFDFFKHLVRGAGDWVYAAWMSLNNSGANGTYYYSIVYGRTEPTSGATPVQCENLHNALPAFRNLGKLPYSTPEMPLSGVDYAKAVGKDFIKHQLVGVGKNIIHR